MELSLIGLYCQVRGAACLVPSRPRKAEFHLAAGEGGRQESIRQEGSSLTIDRFTHLVMAKRQKRKVSCREKFCWDSASQSITVQINHYPRK